MKTHIVYVTIKCVVKCEEDEDPEDVLLDSDYNIENDGKVISTEMMEVEDKGECDPDHHFLLEEHRRDQKRGLYGDA